MSIRYWTYPISLTFLFLIKIIFPSFALFLLSEIDIFIIALLPLVVINFNINSFDNTYNQHDCFLASGVYAEKFPNIIHPNWGDVFEKFEPWYLLNWIFLW